MRRPAAIVDLGAIHAALMRDDLDAALAAGLLEWNGQPLATDAVAFDPGTWAWLRATRQARLDALAARARMLTRNTRLAEQRRARAQRLLDSLPATTAATELAAQAADAAPRDQPVADPALPDSARAALARALAKAGTAPR